MQVRTQLSCFGGGWINRSLYYLIHGSPITLIGYWGLFGRLVAEAFEHALSIHRPNTSGFKRLEDGLFSEQDRPGSLEQQEEVTFSYRN
jgi:hypothetical protein